LPARITRINLTSGDSVDVSDHLTVIVGPNNVGKSVLLGSTWQVLQQQPHMGFGPVPVVSGVELELPSRQEVNRRLSVNAELLPPGQYPHGYQHEEHFYSPQAGVIPGSQIEAILAVGKQQGRLGFLAGQLVMHMPPEGRLGQLGNVAVPNLYGEVPATPLQKMWADRELEKRLQTLARRAFGIDLIVNRHGGSQIGLHIGKPSMPEPAIGERSPYLKEVATLPAASMQGHGVQAFLGMALTLTAGQYDVVLIDEPEAFLHPPQARLLGELFVEFARHETQIIVSTHSDDFLQGVLTASASATDVTIARITRPSPEVNSVAQLPPAAVRELFEDSLLRYSNILSGIFYKGVVLCEAEGDCQYYSAVLDNRFGQSDPSEPRPDLLFTQCGGKDRFAKAAAALRSTQVPTAVIADIDLLADRAKFEEVLTVLGGDPTALSASLNTVQGTLAAKASVPERPYVRFRFAEILDASQTPVLSSAETKQLRDLLKTQSGWELAKKNGRGALPGGGVMDAFNAILAASSAVGLFILPVGELERFHSEVPSSNKQAWLRQVFESGLYADSPTAEALLSEVVAYIARHQ
jgi:hypothetical protein